MDIEKITEKFFTNPLRFLGHGQIELYTNDDLIGTGNGYEVITTRDSNRKKTFNTFIVNRLTIKRKYINIFENGYFYLVTNVGTNTEMFICYSPRKTPVQADRETYFYDKIVLKEVEYEPSELDFKDAVCPCCGKVL